MKKIIAFSILVTALFFNTSFAQFKTNSLTSVSLNQRNLNYNFNKTALGPRVSLGFNAGFALIEDNTGLAIGAFAELQGDGFAFVPQANYWKIEKTNNFELAALMRLKLSSVGLMPYVDGGLGINFYSNKDIDEEFTKLGIAVGGGLELANFGQNYSLMFDAKYKIIINDPGNIDGYVITAGLKFPLQ